MTTGGTMGRPPKPRHLRLLQGNPGRRPLNDDEPQPQKRIRTPSPPEALGDEGKREWRRMGPELIKLGLLTELDLTAFQMYCDTYDRWVDYSRKARELGAVITTPNGQVQQNPYVAMANRTYYMLGQSLSRFGMDPSSRSRIIVDPNQRGGGQEIDELRDWLSRGSVADQQRGD